MEKNERQIKAEATTLSWLFAVLALMSLLGFIFGCASVPQDLDPAIYYKHDMSLQINGTPYQGIAVVPFATSYTMKIESKADVDLFSFTTCRRDFQTEGAIKQGWWKAKRGYTYYFTPNERERDSGCIVRIEGLEKVNGRHSWAIIDFEDATHMLPAKVSCNGDATYTANGVSICQSREGVFQTIEFDVPVDVGSVTDNQKCKMPPSKDGMTWDFPISNRLCIFSFLEMNKVNGVRKRHRLTTIGYEQTPIRGE